MKIREVTKDIIHAPLYHGVILIHVVLQRVAGKGDATPCLQAAHGCKPQALGVLDLMTFIGYNHRCIVAEACKGLPNKDRLCVRDGGKSDHMSEPIRNVMWGRIIHAR